jgi:PKD repeat protein
MVKIANIILVVILATAALVACGTLNAHALVGYQYFQSVNITSPSAGALTNYDVLVNVYSGSGISSGNTIYLNNKAWNFGGSGNGPADVRFTNSSGALLNCWWVNDSGTEAYAWVQIPSIPASPSIYQMFIWYSDGAPGVNSVSNPWATMTFFDNITNASNWATGGFDNSFSIGGGSASSYPPSGQNAWLACTHGITFSNVQIDVVGTVDNGLPIVSVSLNNYTVSWSGNGYYPSGKNGYTIATGTNYVDTLYRNVQGLDSSQDTLLSGEGMAIGNRIWNFDNVGTNTSIYVSNGAGGQYQQVGDTNSMNGQTVYFNAGVNGNSGGTSALTIYQIWARPYTSAEPTFAGNIGEQSVVFPSPSFSGTPLSGPAPLNVTFTDHSSNATSWSWQFGDGGTSTLESPTYLYNATGIYSVTETAYNANGSSSYTVTNYITVTSPAISFQTVVIQGNTKLSGMTVNASYNGTLQQTTTTDSTGTAYFTLTPGFAYSFNVKGTYNGQAINYSTTLTPIYGQYNEIMVPGGPSYTSSDVNQYVFSGSTESYNTTTNAAMVTEWYNDTSGSTSSVTFGVYGSNNTQLATYTYTGQQNCSYVFNVITTSDIIAEESGNPSQFGGYYQNQQPYAVQSGALVIPGVPPLLLQMLAELGGIFVIFEFSRRVNAWVGAFSGAVWYLGAAYVSVFDPLGWTGSVVVFGGFALICIVGLFTNMGGK